MKKLLIAFALVSGLGLSGCATFGPGPAPSPGGGPVATDSQITAIQAAVARGCSYLVAVETVAAIVATFTGGGPIVGLVGQVAHAICNAVAGKSAKRLRAGPPQVNGIIIRGGWIR